MRQSKDPPKKGGRSASKDQFPGVSHYKDRHGRVRWRARIGTSTVNLGTDYGSPEFIARYEAAVKGERIAAPPVRAADVGLAPGQHSLSALFDEWFRSKQYRSLAASTARNYERIAEHLRDKYGDLAVEEFTTGGMLRMMQAKADKPESANGRLRVMRLALDHAVNTLEWLDHNPARLVKKFNGQDTGGYHTWTDPEIQQFFKHWPEGTTADTAMSLMLYTGAARVDAVQLGPQNIVSVGDQRRVRYRRQKMKTRAGLLVDIPLHPELARRLDRLPPKGTFLQTQAGSQRSAAGLGNQMRDWCDSAKLPLCSSHGLRKACARRLAEAGATPHEIMAVTGHKTLAEVQRYTEGVARAGLADKAMERIT